MLIRHLRPLTDTKQVIYKIVEQVYGKNGYYVLSYNNKRLKISKADLEQAILEKRLRVT